MSNKKDRYIKEEVVLAEILNYANEGIYKKPATSANSLINSEIKVVAKNESQKHLIQSIKNNDITICSGMAGSGKTYVAVALALGLLKKPGNGFKKIYLIKPVVPLKDEEIGFLKGGLKEKLDPIMWSFYINMLKVISETELESLLEKGVIVPYPLAYIKGASIDDGIVIGDEIENMSVRNSRVLMTRIGSNCKMILLGDVDQIDMRKPKDSSLDVLLKIFKEHPGIGVVQMSDKDINTRHPMITGIEAKYKKYYEQENRE